MAQLLLNYGNPVIGIRIYPAKSLIMMNLISVKFSFCLNDTFSGR